MADRRRVNGPVGQTAPPVYDSPRSRREAKQLGDNAIRKIFLKTGVTPSASGSAYLEIEDPNATGPSSTSLKLTCTVHGPRALPRSAPFSPHIILSTHVKYAPFATRQRRGYLRDASERDLGVHLETALRGAIIADRWPKSGVDIIVTIIEGDQNRDSPDYDGDEGWDVMNVLSGCITVASAAIADAGIDCVDTVAGGVAALVAKDDKSPPFVVLDPDVAGYHKIFAACCAAYLPTRDEVTNIWFKGQLPGADAMIYNKMVERSLVACRNANRVLVSALNETVRSG
ncbi:exoribonuclease [Durotheca rogersii]|uniref:exoribonuclease n=1 Tax=Durotheca rogersii TaxID=419775 RepID=UPI00221FA795|nr:exoribonuclease [Durotheca rogersii]KAI5866464.1 exoribonuclease [Durotheca rogersii]